MQQIEVPAIEVTSPLALGALEPPLCRDLVDGALEVSFRTRHPQKAEVDGFEHTGRTRWIAEEDPAAVMTQARQWADRTGGGLVRLFRRESVGLVTLCYERGAARCVRSNSSSISGSVTGSEHCGPMQA